MAEHIPMRRFPDDVDGNDGVYSPEGREYGAGAFNWKVHNGLLYIVFRHPDNVWTNSAGEKFGIKVLPVNDGRWAFDGDRDKPTIQGSIKIMTSVPEHMREEVRHLTDTDGWTETFHGFITKGVLKVL